MAITAPPLSLPSGLRALRRPWFRTLLRPADQPGWARPGLLAVAALAALIFTWGAFHTTPNDFYAADARSMSMSWKNFLYGSFDPAGAVTIDKLWGFLWPQALSIKLFGYSSWALALPEAVEGVVSVLVLYRLTRRWTGRADVALLAAGVFTLTPIVASTFGHSGLEDNALTMCLVLATDAFIRALDTGRLRSLLLSGFWVGMAFQTKMVQAWTVVPVFGLVYLICAPHGLGKRIRHTLLAGAVTLAASLWLLVIVQLTPAADRPFIDGSSGSNNIFSMVFSYNFTSRFGSLNPGGSSNVGALGGGSDWGKLFGADFGSQIGWLYPLALIALVYGLIKRKGAGRTDLVRAGYLMWGGTLLVTALAFSAGTIPHSQYMTVLAPGLSALCAAGIVALHKAFVAGERLGRLLIAAIAATVAWATYLSYENTVFLTWLPPLVILLGLLGIASLVGYRLWRDGALAIAGTVIGATAMLATPAAWALSTFETQYNGTNINAAAGPYSGRFGTAARGGGFSGGEFPGGGFPGGGARPGFGGGFEGRGGIEGHGFGAGGFGGGPGAGPGGAGAPGGSATLSTSEQSLIAYLEQHQGSAKYLMAVMSSSDAESYVADEGVSILPVGGFSGGDGYPAPPQFKALIASGEVRYVLLSDGGGGGRGGGLGATAAGSNTTSDIESWVRASCSTVSSSAYAGSAGSTASGTLYACTA